MAKLADRVWFVAMPDVRYRGIFDIWELVEPVNLKSAFINEAPAIYQAVALERGLGSDIYRLVCVG